MAFLLTLDRVKIAACVCVCACRARRYAEEGVVIEIRPAPVAHKSFICTERVHSIRSKACESFLE